MPCPPLTGPLPVLGFAGCAGAACCGAVYWGALCCGAVYCGVAGAVYVCWGAV